MSDYAADRAYGNVVLGERATKLPRGVPRPSQPTTNLLGGAVATSQYAANVAYGNAVFGPQATQIPTQTMPFGADAPPPGASDAELEKWIREKYPYFAAFLGNTEVRRVLFEAARNKWGEAELYGALSRTNWWQTTSAAARDWQRLVAEDPAEARRLASQTAASLQNRVRTLGLNLSADQIASIAATATANGWTDPQTIDNLLNSVNWSTVQGGDLTAMRDQAKRIAAAYLVRLSDQTAQDYAVRMASGELSEAGIASIMQRQARQRYTWMADLIDQGVTPEDYLRPVRDTIANELEVAPDSIDLMDPRWMRMVETRDEQGALRAATLNEAMLAARSDPGWAKTQKAQERTAQLLGMIGDVFGRKAV